MKQWLKDARDLIKAKEYKNALKEVKKVLKKDKENYMGLVFCGLCLSELEEPAQAIQVRQCEVPVFEGSIPRKGPLFTYRSYEVILGAVVVF